MPQLSFTRYVFCLALPMLLTTLVGCSLSPTYTVRVENESNRPLRATLERRPTINEIIAMDSLKVKPNESRVLGPSTARPLERVYLVIGDRTDLHALPESVELRRGEWVVTIDAGSMTSWGTYELSVRKADEPLVAEDEPDTDD
ncbi:MAG: hypothetical protein NXI07_02565 [bacterium]|nr:hypothetical protein [bacterium]